jgi:putative flippase GtrA
VSRPALGEALRFAVVGLAAYGTDLLVFNALLLGASVPSVPAKVVAAAAAIAVAFAGSRWWTWRHRRGPHIGREYALFLLASVLAAGIQVGCLLVSRELLGLRSAVADNVSANVVGMALATAFRFWAFRTVVFPERSAAAAGPARVTAGAAGTPARGRGAARS